MARREPKVRSAPGDLFFLAISARRLDLRRPHSGPLEPAL